MYVGMCMCMCVYVLVCMCVGMSICITVYTNHSHLVALGSHGGGVRGFQGPMGRWGQRFQGD